MVTIQQNFLCSSNPDFLQFYIQVFSRQIQRSMEDLLWAGYCVWKKAHKSVGMNKLLYNAHTKQEKHSSSKYKNCHSYTRKHYCKEGKLILWWNVTRRTFKAGFH